MGSYTGMAYLQKAQREWAAGKVIPHRITMALDARGLDGPGVDAACGVEEPAVDMWEAGTLYPTFEQLCALAELCGVLPHLFTSALLVDYPVHTSLRFHKIGGKLCDWVPPPPVRAFTPEAIAAANLPKPPPPPTNTPKPPNSPRRLRRVA